MLTVSATDGATVNGITVYCECGRRLATPPPVALDELVAETAIPTMLPRWPRGFHACEDCHRLFVQPAQVG